MTPAVVIHEAARRGITLRVAGADLLYHGPRGALCPELKAALKDLKPAIIAELTGAKAASVFCPANVIERAAIIAEGNGCSHEEADRWALAGQGYSSWRALADELRRIILKQLACLPPPINDHGRCLLRVTRVFLDTNHWQAAVALGWSLIELFGINPNAPVGSIDGQGLVTGLALSNLNGGRLEVIAEGHATIRYRSGSLLTWRRASELDAAVLWWECDALR